LLFEPKTCWKPVIPTMRRDLQRAKAFMGIGKGIRFPGVVRFLDKLGMTGWGGFVLFNLIMYRNVRIVA